MGCHGAGRNAARGVEGLERVSRLLRLCALTCCSSSFIARDLGPGTAVTIVGPSGSPPGKAVNGDDGTAVCSRAARSFRR